MTPGAAEASSLYRAQSSAAANTRSELLHTCHNVGDKWHLPLFVSWFLRCVHVRSTLCTVPLAGSDSHSHSQLEVTQEFGTICMNAMNVFECVSLWPMSFEVMDIWWWKLKLREVTANSVSPFADVWKVFVSENFLFFLNNHEKTQISCFDSQTLTGHCVVYCGRNPNSLQ